MTRAQEYRCGWLDNPSPGNYWLIDRDAVWVIAEQGGKRAENSEFLTPTDESEFVNMNHGYGYSCACISAETDENHHSVNSIIFYKQLPLIRCNTDRDLEHRNLDFNQDTRSK
ncbi:DUF4087 domain-containing protein [Marinobacter mangrovi]|uniref:DUF4087 domain-containing protein n=1 Tax=Marinobacter mangrovi TaxID=2803918 RepID=UPI0019317F81